MENTFTVELFDLLVYLLPGLILLLACYLYFEKKLPKNFFKSESKVVIVYALFFSFFLGVLAHIFASGCSYIYKLTVSTNYIHETLLRLDDWERERIKVLVANKYHLDTSSANDVALDSLIYRYAETGVKEKASHNNASISRLMALSIFCRNSMAPLGILMLVVVLRFREQTWLYVPGLFLVEILLFLGAEMYRTAAVNQVFRTFIILYSDG